MRLILVTHDSPYARYLASALHEAVRLDELLVETGSAPARFYWRKLRRVGPANFAFQFWLNRWFRREGARHLPARAMPPHQRLTTVNGRAFGADDLVIGFGTSYITPATLAAAPRGILNLHTGLLPHYRGVKSEFWTLYHGDAANAGWTLHYMTPKLDAGDLVLQGRVPWAGENPAALRARLLVDAAPAIAGLVRRVRSQGFDAIPRTPQGDGRYYTTPTWGDWRRLKRETRNAKRDVPRDA